MTEEKPLSDAEFIENMKSFRLDHEPDGWPAIRQRDLDRLIGLIFKVADNEEGMLTVHILRHWGTEKTRTFCKHLLGDECQKCGK